MYWSSNLKANRFWLLASGFWLLASGFWLLASGFWLLADKLSRTTDKTSKKVGSKPTFFMSEAECRVYNRSYCELTDDILRLPFSKPINVIHQNI
ncbi:hypothetical protein CWO10_05935 [Vibrio splendidus]|nr:hypothetical protein CWO10_05935 [Vibrio splendidus]